MSKLGPVRGAVKGTDSSVTLRRWARGRDRDSARKEAMFLIASVRLEILVSHCKQRMAAKSNRERIRVLRPQKRLVSPTEQHRPRSVSGGDRDQKDQIAFAEALLLERVHEAQRN